MNWNRKIKTSSLPEYNFKNEGQIRYQLLRRNNNAFVNPLRELCCRVKSEESIKEFNNRIENLSRKVYDKVESKDFASEFSDVSREYIKSNISSLILDFDKQDVEGINQLLRLPFFYGLIDNMVEIKFV
jgi:hypothetical protein